MTTIHDTPAHPWSAADEVELDVRDDLRRGREPFRHILAAVEALAPAQVLHLRAIFEPLPLYRVLARRGFAAASQAHAPDDWSVWFHRAAPDATDTRRPAARTDGEPTAAAPAAGGPTDVTLDVRGLTPPEPLQRTLAALDTLPADATLVQLNARVPQFLLPLLHERGFAYAIDRSSAEHVTVRIQRAR